MNPPTIDCPAEVAMADFNTTNQNVLTEYPQIEISDWSGLGEIRIEPPEGTVVPMLTPTDVEVTAEDALGNIANCHFVYFPQRE